MTQIIGNIAGWKHAWMWVFLVTISIGYVASASTDEEGTTTAAAGLEDDYEKGDEGSDEIQDLQLDGELTDQTLQSGDKLQFRCKVSVSPKKDLVFTWYHDNTKIEPDGADERVTIRARDWGSRLQITNVYTADSGRYRCEASDGEKSVDTTAELRVTFNLPPDGGSPTIDNGIYKGKCELYKGFACADYLKGKLIYVESFQQQTQMEQAITAAVGLIGNENKVSENCAKFARPAFCHFVFPLCEMQAENAGDTIPYDDNYFDRGEIEVNNDDKAAAEGTATAIRLCREDCELLQHDVCAKEFASTDPSIKALVSTTDCSRLPRTTATGTKCSRLGLKSVVDRTHVCYNDTGVAYMGVTSVAENGLNCKPWPVKMLNEYPELAGGHNFCRNPSNAMDQPWCYVDRNRVKKVACSVPKCESAKNAGSPVLLMILIPCIAIPLLIGCIVAVMCVARKRGKNAKHTPGKKVEMKSTNLKKTLIPELPAALVHFSVELGEGKYGKVYKAQIMSNMVYSPAEPVAAKTVAAGAMQAQINEFQREMDMFADLQHINVSCLKACVVQPTLRCMIFEYTSRVDLHELLTLHSPHSDIGGGKISGSASSHTSSSLEEGDFLHMAVQVASGLEYLASQNFIHRDLAARNILVCSNNIMKISNLGAVRDCYLSSYYRSPQGGHMLPVRWMAPESFTSNMFSEKTVVWSFGVMVWEMFSYGLQPYCGYSNHEVIEMISKGQTLTCPDQCSSRVYALLRECWSNDPHQRPTCKELHAKLSGWEGATTTRMTSQLAQGIHRQLTNVMREGSQFQYTPPQGTVIDGFGQTYMASPQQPEPPHTSPASQTFYTSPSASSSGIISHPPPPSYPSYIQQPQAYPPPVQMYPQQQMHYVRPHPASYPYKSSHTHSSSRSTDSGGSSVRNQLHGYRHHPGSSHSSQPYPNQPQHFQQQQQPTPPPPQQQQQHYENVHGTPDSGVHSAKGVPQPQNNHNDQYRSGSVTSGSPPPPPVVARSRPGSELVQDGHKLPPIGATANGKPAVAPKPPMSPKDPNRPRGNIVMGLNGQRNRNHNILVENDVTQVSQIDRPESNRMKNGPTKADNIGALSCDSGLPNDEAETDSGENQPFISKQSNASFKPGKPAPKIPGSSSSSMSGSTSVTAESRLTS